MTTATGASAPAVFHFNALPVTVITKDGEPWFVASEICAALEINNSRMAVRRLDDDEKGVSKTDTLGGEQEVSIINEPGLYRLIGRSNKPAAKAFSRWVCHDVLPSIRKTGRYDSSHDRLSAPAPTFANRRWVIVVAPDGSETAKALDLEHFIAKIDELPETIRDPGFLITSSELVEIIRACADRLSGKLGARRKIA